MRAPPPFEPGLPKSERARPGRRWSTVLVITLLAAGCSAEFTPRSVLDDLRVIALVTTPLEAGPSEEVTVTAVAIPPPNETIAEERWTFCPLSIGATVAYACAVPQCEVPLTPRADRSVSATPGALARACLAQIAAQGSLPPGIPPVLPAQITTLFRYVVTSASGQQREAVQRFTVYTAADPTVRNHAPVITAVQIGGRDVLGGGAPPTLTVGHGLEVRVLVDPASAEAYLDAGRATLRETLVVSYYTTAGRFDYDRASGPDARVSLNHDRIDPNATEARVWAVARDLRGGETVVGPFPVPITH